MIAALRRAGFVEARRSKGSHQTYKKQTPERTLVTVVPLDKNPVARRTLESIIELAGLSVEDFLRFLR